MSERELPLPPRPALPTALWALSLACACQLGIARASLGGSPRQLGVCGAALSFCSVLGVLGVIYLLRHHVGAVRLTVCVMLTCASCASASACLCYRNGVLAAQSLATSAMSSWRFEVLSDPSPTDTGYRCRARARKEGAPIGDVWLLSKEPFERGATIRCIARFRPLGRDSYSISSWSQGVCGSVSALRVLDCRCTAGPMRLVLEVRARALNQLLARQSEAGALLAGCVCGSRTALDESGLTEVFATCGLSHMVAVSGSHLATIALMVSGVLEYLCLSPKMRLPLLGVVTGLFVLFCGCPISAVRAWLMLLIAYASQLAGRRTHALTAVSVVALVMVLLDATVVGQLGFQLSVLSVAGLCVYSQHAGYVMRSLTSSLRMPRFVGSHVRHRFDEGKASICQMLAATLVCQLVTLPVTASVFGQLSLVAPLATIVATPILGVLLGLGLAACLLSRFPFMTNLMVSACEVLTAPLLFALNRLARLPCATVSSGIIGVPLGAVAVLLLIAWLVWWPRVKPAVVRAFALLVILVALGTYTYWRCLAPARVVVFDIGQGDAILVQDGPTALLVDTGPDKAIVDALARRHVMHLDAVVLTHLHDDHYGGLAYLGGSIRCNQVIVARGVADALPDELRTMCRELTQKELAELSYGDILTVGGFELRMIWPHEEVDGDENSESLELYVNYQRRGSTLTALLTGDAEQDELAACIQSHDVGDIDVLKVGHHGSEVSLTPEQARIIHPELAVASAGEGNRYGHPSQACIAALQAAGAQFLCTKDVGDVEVRPGVAGPIVRVYGVGALRTVLQIANDGW